jgi:glycerol uptake facilitator-like aquaporin
MLRAVEDPTRASTPSTGDVHRRVGAPDRRPLAVRVTAEAIGTAALLVGVVGSAIAADRLTSDLAVQLLIQAIATGGVVAVAVLVLRPVSSAHLNPAVTLARWSARRMRGGEALVYAAAQLVGAVVGVMVANVMFNERAIEWSTTTRSSGQLWLSEAVATGGLVFVALALSRLDRRELTPWAVAAWMAVATLATPSHAFANPAATLARTLTDTPAGIARSSAPMFVLVQLAAAMAAYAVVALLLPRPAP